MVLNSDGDPNGKDWKHQMTPNTWHLVKIVGQIQDLYHGTTTVYVDDMTTAAGSCSGCSLFLQVGNPWTLSLGDFDGDIDEVRISDVVR